ALKELEKIELIRQPNGNYKLDHAVTVTQKVILGAFGLDEEWIKAQARQMKPRFPKQKNNSGALKSVAIKRRRS
ncbi:hypothetical protein ACXO4P_09475, partial [Lactobacillus delbrueckii subsp. bulgaricus]|nr:hypothetical protein [Lactobacillus delbrueckii subsp. bulgaricus]MBT8851600.1 hypothetical protein [Lactobacillus delbrueckii subsp. bulgaricus]